MQHYGDCQLRPILMTHTESFDVAQVFVTTSFSVFHDPVLDISQDYLFLGT